MDDTKTTWDWDVQKMDDDALVELSHAVTDEMALRLGLSIPGPVILGETRIDHPSRKVHLGDHDYPLVASGGLCFFLPGEFAADHLKGYRLWAGDENLHIAVVAHFTARVHQIIGPDARKNMCRRLGIAETGAVTQVWVQPEREKDE